jgi:hypothetical protein
LTAFGGQLGDEFLSLAFVHLEHSRNLQIDAESYLLPILQRRKAVKPLTARLPKGRILG